ncbi:MAG: class I SAM-dependent methyltransferase [bacterium]|nr:class I SAM-dependent methyltransferase [bacterium]
MVSQKKNPLLYTELSSWWLLFTPTEEYQEEAAFYTKLFVEKSASPPRTLLELGSGGGNNASFMKNNFQMTLVDRSEDMIQVSQNQNPKCEHIIGDMRTVRLNRLFDGVFIHDAVAYMKSEQDLYDAMRTAYVHCRVGGIALFAPDFVRETFQPSTSHGGIDGAGRGIRYLEFAI